jgi:uncharacterized protein
LARVLITGGTGFVGSGLAECLLRDGHEVAVLGRDAGHIRQKFGGRVRAVLWATPNDSRWVDDLAGFDVIFNLVGAQAVGVRLTAKRKQEIRDSRVKNTRDLVGALCVSGARQVRLISASAVGIYGARPPEEVIDETSRPGHGFLAEVCHEWETAAQRAAECGIKVVRARLGVVFGPGGGAFETMARPFRLGIGGWIGDGRQGISFISLEDAVRALRFCFDQSAIEGPVNVTTPFPVSARELALAFAGLLARPNWLPVPAFALRALYGEGAQALLTGQRVLPKVLQHWGFDWIHPNIEEALASAGERRDQESDRGI